MLHKLKLITPSCIFPMFSVFASYLFLSLISTSSSVPLLTIHAVIRFDNHVSAGPRVESYS